MGLSYFNFSGLRSLTAGLIASAMEFAANIGSWVSTNNELQKHGEIYCRINTALMTPTYGLGGFRKRDFDGNRGSSNSVPNSK
jgi:hypothetical protein